MKLGTIYVQTMSLATRQERQKSERTISSVFSS